MVNPPRDEIRKIRAQLQQYGQVGDANVFYWFQNRKSRSKQKNRQLHNTKSQTHHAPPITTTMAAASSILPPSVKYSPSSIEKIIFSVCSSTLMDISNSLTGSANQSIFQTPNEFLAEPYIFPVQQPSEVPSTAAFTQGFCFLDVSDHVTDHTAGNCCSSLTLSELMPINHEPSEKANQDDHEKMKLQQQLSCSVTTAPNSTQAINVVSPTLCVPFPMNQIQDVGESGGGPTKSTVFINDVCFEVELGELFNVKEAFGDDAVLIHSFGQPGALYYLARTFTPPADDRTIELVIMEGVGTILQPYLHCVDQATEAAETGLLPSAPCHVLFPFF